MKKLKSLLPFLLMLFALVGCKTDDLEKDIDSLKDRVTSLEAQVSLLNDNLNAIRVILDGSKTISSYTSENGTYTLTLSDGSTIALTQGSEGQIVMPDITINENGQWVLNGEVIGQATGNSGITPKFNISADKYWQVSFDEGKTYEYVLDENGEKVAATTSGNVSVSDAFFEDVKVENDMLVVTLNGGETYSLPIVANLKANIVDPAEGFKNGVWTIGYGETVTTEVEISGDNEPRPAPADNHDQGTPEEPEGLDQTPEGINNVNSEVSSFYVADNVINFINVDKAWIYSVDGGLVKYLTNPDKYSVADFANGAYIVRMQYGKVIRSGKFVK